MIDLHCHILPGIDDGPETASESLALAAEAARSSIATIVATPHVSRHYPNDAAVIDRVVEGLNREIDDAGIDLAVRTGAEIAITRVVDIAPEELSRLTLGDGPWLLIEMPFVSVLDGLDVLVVDLMSQGFGVVIAHPERCPAFQRKPEMLDRLVRAGALSSVTASALTGRFGESVRHFADWLIEGGLAHNVASDAHDALGRPPHLAQDIQQAGLDAGLTEWMCEMVPAAILAGGDIPPRPQRPHALRRTIRRRLLRRAW